MAKPSFIHLFIRAAVRVASFSSYFPTFLNLALPFLVVLEVAWAAVVFLGVSEVLEVS
jgi:hypothetical protein